MSVPPHLLTRSPRKRVWSAAEAAFDGDPGAAAAPSVLIDVIGGDVGGGADHRSDRQTAGGAPLVMRIWPPHVQSHAWG